MGARQGGQAAPRFTGRLWGALDRRGESRRNDDDDEGRSWASVTLAVCRSRRGGASESRLDVDVALEWRASESLQTRQAHEARPTSVGQSSSVDRRRAIERRKCVDDEGVAVVPTSAACPCGLQALGSGAC